MDGKNFNKGSQIQELSECHDDKTSDGLKASLKLCTLKQI